MQDNVKKILAGLKQNTDREGLKDTPKRYIKFLEEFLNPPSFIFTTFKNEGNDQMVIVKDIPFYSLCEHHLAPFFGTVSVGYIPVDRIAGLSKLPRAVDSISNALQNQERIGTQLAEFLNKELAPKGVMIVIKARHMCMEMRGVKKTGSETITSAVLGVFKDDINCRQEFLNLIK